MLWVAQQPVVSKSNTKIQGHPLGSQLEGYESHYCGFNLQLIGFSPLKIIFPVGVLILYGDVCRHTVLIRC